MVYWADFVYSPPWFYGKDVAIDVVSAIVVLMIAAFCFRNFFLTQKNKKHLILGGAFTLLGGSFIIKIITSLLTHSYAGISRQFWFSFLGAEIIGASSFLSAIGFMLFAVLTLFGFYILYALSSRDELSMNYVIIAYFILITAYFTRFTYYIIYLTAFIFIFALARRYYLSYKENKYRNTRNLFISFSVIALSQFVFIFTSSNPALYAVAELIQLVGYLLLLYTFVMVLRNAKKKD